MCARCVCVCFRLKVFDRLLGVLPVLAFSALLLCMQMYAVILVLKLYPRSGRSFWSMFRTRGSPPGGLRVFHSKWFRLWSNRFLLYVRLNWHTYWSCMLQVIVRYCSCLIWFIFVFECLLFLRISARTSISRSMRRSTSTSMIRSRNKSRNRSTCISISSSACTSKTVIVKCRYTYVYTHAYKYKHKLVYTQTCI